MICSNAKLMQYLMYVICLWHCSNILVIGYNEDGTDHDEAVYSVLRQCQEVNLKLNKDKCHFRYMSILFFGEVVSREGVQPDPQKNQGTD